MSNARYSPPEPRWLSAQARTCSDSIARPGWPLPRGVRGAHRRRQGPQIRGGADEADRSRGRHVVRDYVRCGVDTTAMQPSAERQAPCPAPLPTAPGTVQIDYVNWRGERSVRHIVPQCLYLAEVEWHPGQQWILDASTICEARGGTSKVGRIRSWAEHAIVRLEKA
jgi:hypothetical protein